MTPCLPAFAQFYYNHDTISLLSQLNDIWRSALKSTYVSLFVVFNLELAGSESSAIWTHCCTFLLLVEIE